MPTYPEFPVGIELRYVRDSFRRGPHHRALVTSDTEDGPEESRIQSETLLKEIPVGLLMTENEYELFENFMEKILIQASTPFPLKVPVKRRTLELRLVYIKGGDWSDRPEGDKVIVNMVLCVYPPEVLS